MTSLASTSIPEDVRAKLSDILPAIRRKKMKGMVCPAGGFTAALFSENLLSGEEITGLLDNDDHKQGTTVLGFPVKPVSSIETNPPDFIIVASMSFGREIVSQLVPFVRRNRTKIIDLFKVGNEGLALRMPFLCTKLLPVPQVILRNLIRHRATLTAAGSRVLLLSTDRLAMNLWMRGILADLNVVGVVEPEKNPTCTSHQAFIVYSPDELEDSGANIILITSRTCLPKISALHDRTVFRTIDLSQGMNIDDFRSEWAECLKQQIWANRLPEIATRKVQICLAGRSLDDSLCAISAAREFARRNPSYEVHCDGFPEIIEAYGDSLVKSDCRGYTIPEQSIYFLSEPWSLLAGNYQGCYYLGLGMNFVGQPRPELPSIHPLQGFSPGSYIVLNPGIEGLELIPSNEQLNSIVQRAPLPIVCIGDRRTRGAFKGADCFHFGSPLEILSIIQRAALVITPRRTFSHIAAAYDVPAVIWTPHDEFNWHIDYAPWKHRRILPSSPDAVQQSEEALNSLIYRT